MVHKKILDKQYPTSSERKRLAIVKSVPTSRKKRILAKVKRELRIAIGDQKAFNENQRIIEKKGKIKEKRFRRIVKKELKRGFN